MTKIGLAFQSDKSPQTYAQLAQAAESYDIDVLSVFSDLMFQPPILALLEMARVTDRVRLGAACWNPYSLHPYEIAGQLAALDLASNGRAYLGLARGSWLGDVGIEQPRPISHLREAVEVIYRLMEGKTDGYHGEIFQLAPDVRLRYAVRRPRPPLLIGTWGERTAAFADGLADEVKIGGTTNPAVVARMRKRLKSSALVVGAVTVVDTDGAAARARAKTEVATYLPVVAELDSTVQVPVDLLVRMQALVTAGESEAAGALVPDELLDLFAFAGTPAEVAARARAVIDAGAARVEFGTPHGLSDERGVHLLGAEVVPRLRR
ncbi:5,10-methylenetetrahydromethanopterin reductase [Fodinicola feengrottensis]|uniref:5,10-methylenetetrahydromethanopterin reductase n=1 Tax=Fodinicola feengrottensis TaxID=435914 RepID=A0ABP4U1U9_9ACTN